MSTADGKADHPPVHVVLGTLRRCTACDAVEADVAELLMRVIQLLSGHP